MKTASNSFEKTLHMRLLAALTALMLVAAVQAYLTSGRFELPQKSGSSLLTLISDDTRMVLSGVMMKKVDDYFHGGAKAENCTLEQDAARIVARQNGSASAAESGAGHDHEHCSDKNCTLAHTQCSDAGCTHDHDDHSVSASGLDPFKWINVRVHAQEHRHLDKARSVEMLPWVTAAVKSAPHNVQAYETGSYILDQMTDNPQVAVDFLEEGIKNNPESVVLESSLGEIYFNSLKQPEHAQVHFESALAKSLKLEGELMDDERFQRMRICFYLGLIARGKHDTEKLRSVYEISFNAGPSNIMSLTLLKWLEEEEVKKRE